MAYSTDADLVKVQQNILDLGVSNWNDQHDESALIIDRDVTIAWYQSAASAIGISDGFNSDLVIPDDQFLRLSVYKTLELAYLFLMQDAEEDPFRIKMKLFAGKYDVEFNKVIDDGISYDWNQDGSGDELTNTVVNSRRLVR